MVQTYQKGDSLESVASRFQCSAVTVRNVLLRHDVPRRRSGSPPLPRTPEQLCVTCNTERPRADFHGNGKRKSCRFCVSDQRKVKYHSAHESERQRIATRTKYRAANGWTSEAFDKAWSAQEGKCGICSVPMAREGRGPTSVTADHDHSTNEPRALLCSGCNRGLGCFKDAPHILQLAADYLRKHSSKG